MRWLPLIFAMVLVQAAPITEALRAATEAGNLQRR
jgi:hypothetical protein